MLKAALAVVLAVVSVGAQGVRVVDQGGYEVFLPHVPQRVASVFGVATPYLYALGAAPLVVGARYLGLPDSPVGPRVMGRIDPDFAAKAFPGEVNVETLLGLKPDVVLLGLRHRELAQQLRDLGIPAVTYAPENPDQITQAIALTGKILGREAQAAAVLEFWEGVVAAVEQATRDIPFDQRPRVLFVGTNPGRVPGKDMYQTHLIHLAGGQSVSRELPGAWQNVSPEQILLWDPEVIVIAPYGPVQPQDFLADPLYAQLAAVKSGRVVKMPQILFSWDTPIPESALGIVWLAQILHPGKVGLDLLSTLHVFYRNFYGVQLEPEEWALIGGAR